MMRTVNKLAVATLSLLALTACDSAPVPAAIEADINPSRVWYHTGQTVELLGIVTDFAERPIEDVEVAWTAEPASAATMGAAGSNPSNAVFTLETQGRVEFTGCVVPSNPDLEPTLCDTLAVRVDDGMPTLEVSSPTPGAELDDEAGITVTGSVADRSMVRVYVNGMPSSPDEMGNFSATVPAMFGSNHITVAATDGLTDASTVEMDVMWAPAYTPAMGMDGTPSIGFDDGLELWLGQDFFDDGAPVDVETRPVVTADLAGLLEVVIANLDVASVIPDPLVDSPPTFTLRLRNASVGAPEVEMDLTDDGADLFIRIGRIEADTQGALIVDTTSLPLHGTITGSAVAFAQLTIRKDDEASPLEVTMGELTVGIESLEGSFESVETQAVFALAEGLLRTTLEGALSDAVNDSILDSVPGLLQDALGAVDEALDNQEILLDSPPFGPVTIEIDGGINQINLNYQREMQATLRTSVGTDATSVHPGSRGIARIDPFDFTPPFLNEGRLQVGVRLGFLNGLTHALWSSGLLNVDVTPILPEAATAFVSAAVMDGQMPPVLRPARIGEEGPLVLTLGQLELVLTVMGEEVRYGVSLDASVNVTVMDNRIAIEVGETPSIHVWTIVPHSNPRLLGPDVIADLLATLWPDLRDSIAGGLAFELPIPGLGDLGGLAPALADFTLALQEGEPMRIRGGVVVLDAVLEGTLP